LQVEDTLFRLPQHVFTKHSPVFQKMFSEQAQADDDASTDGEFAKIDVGDKSLDERPLVLEGIKASEFVSLLKLIYPT
jgi:hypothetical protein